MSKGRESEGSPRRAKAGGTLVLPDLSHTRTSR
jgi:hypothetical protein